MLKQQTAEQRPCSRQENQFSPFPAPSNPGREIAPCPWNQVSATKEFTTPFHITEFEKYVGKDARILDVGCGYGRTLQELHELGFRHLAGIDFSKGMIELPVFFLIHGLCPPVRIHSAFFTS